MLLHTLFTYYFCNTHMAWPSPDSFITCGKREARYYRMLIKESRISCMVTVYLAEQKKLPGSGSFIYYEKAKKIAR